MFVDFYLYKKNIQKKVLQPLDASYRRLINAQLEGLDTDACWQKIADTVRPFENQLRWLRSNLEYEDTAWYQAILHRMDLYENTLRSYKERLITQCRLNGTSSPSVNQDIKIAAWLALEDGIPPSTHQQTQAFPHFVTPEQYKEYIEIDPIQPSASLKVQINIAPISNQKKIICVISLVVSLMLYVSFSPLILASVAFFHVAHLFFIALLLTPIAYLIFDWLRRIPEIIRACFHVNLKCELQWGLALLQNNQDEIKNHLLSGISDIIHFDSDAFEQRANQMIENIEMMKTTLHQKVKILRYFKQSELALLVENTLNSLEKQKERVKNILSLLAITLPDRVELSIVELDASRPCLQSIQIHKLQRFVEKYQISSLPQFNQKIDLAYYFIKKLRSEAWLQPDDKTSDVPWGGSRARLDVLEGWYTLTKHWPGIYRTETFLIILDLFKGTLDLSKTNESDESTELAEPTESKSSTVDLSSIDAELQDLIKTFLFKTLNPTKNINKAIQTLDLLHVHDQEKIETWYEAHFDAIYAANNRFISAINNKDHSSLMDTHDLIADVDLLDGAALGSALAQDNRITNQRVFLQDFFQNYDGSNPFAHYYLRFMLVEEHKGLLDRVMQKRWTYLLNQDNASELRMLDIYLSKDARVTVRLVNIIENHLCEVEEAEAEKIKPLLRTCYQSKLIEHAQLHYYTKKGSYEYSRR